MEYIFMFEWDVQISYKSTTTELEQYVRSNID